jgi:ABC-type uncharacterized transport system ATPase subunit
MMFTLLVDTYKYLGTVFDNKLKFPTNTEVIVKKGQQRVHLLRMLNSFSVSTVILRISYQSFIESFNFFIYMLD